MRILLCNKYYFPFSGTELYLLQLETLLRGKGHPVAFFSTTHPRNHPSPYEKYFVPYVDLKDPGLGLWTRIKMARRMVYYGGARGRIARLLQDFRPQVAHVRNIYHHISPSVLWELRKWRVPVVLHLNDFKILCPNYNFISRGRVCEKCKGGKFRHVLSESCHSSSRASNLVLFVEAELHKRLGTYRKCVDRFLAPSEFCRRKLVENGWEEAKIRVLYHFQEIPPEAELEIQDDYVLFFGRISREKGLEDLLRAMARIPRIPLLVVGEGPLRPELERWAAGRNLSNVRFLGRREGIELHRIIRGARFTVMPSVVFETLGKVILESYALGRPVIASDLGPRSELVEDGRTGLLYKPGDVEELAEKISYLHSRPALCRQMGTEGQRRVREKHSPEAHCRQLLAIYREAGGEGPL